MQNLLRTPLTPGACLTLQTAQHSTAMWEITGFEGAGGSSLCYRARCGSKSGRLKEFYPQAVPPVFCRSAEGLPVALGADAREQCRDFCRSYELLEQCKAKDSGAELLNNFIPPYELLRGGDSVYVWTPDDKQGVSFEYYLQQAWKKPEQSPEHKLYNILSTVLTLTDSIRVFHRAGLLHLDIKPENFLVLYDGQFNISPANISLFDINTVCLMEQASAVPAGTDGYFAPEVPRGRADNRSDIYSIGAMLMRALINPGNGRYNMQMYRQLDQHLAASPLLRASQNNENVFLRHVLGAILKKSLAPRPGDRYGSCEELMQELEQAITLLLPDVAGGKLGLQKRLAILDTEPQDDCDPESVLCDLLFRYGLDRHLLPEEQKLQVLVVGAGTYGQKFMDICLQAGQLLDRHLQITALSQNPELDREIYLQVRPALPDFVDCGDPCPDAYATIKFLPMELSGASAEQDMGQLLKKLGKIHCAFIALGDDRLNEQTARLLISCGVTGDVHFAVRSREPVQTKWGNPVNILRPVKPGSIHPQLEQMALRTHLSWMNTNKPDLPAAKRQFRKKYNRRASLAYALSVPTKLRSVGIDPRDPRQAAAAFCALVSEKSDRLQRLTALEHRRWVLEKVTAGWKSSQDLESGIARGSMRDDQRKTHPCILPGTAAMPLQHFTQAQWDTPGPWDETLDRLDLLSVKQHRLCRAEAIRLGQTGPLQTGEPALIRRRLAQAPAPVKAAFDGYQLCLSRILQGSTTAAEELDRYESALLQSFTALKPVLRRELTQRLKQVRTEFFPAIEACLYRDYKAQDAQMILRIPHLLDPQEPRYQSLAQPLRPRVTERCTQQGTYTPKPRETDGILLPGQLLELTEQLAENIHDLWAAGRMEEGWTYGPSRDDSARTHPCLVPYDALPESEKAYDRSTAMQTLKYITMLGYRILPPEEG